MSRTASNCSAVMAGMLCLLVAAAPALAERTPPMWPAQFSARATEVTIVPFLKNWTFEGEYYYDFLAGGNLWKHGDGQLEMECIEVYPDSEGKPCHTLSTTWNGFHVVIPEDHLCCHWGQDSLNTPVRPDWLVRSNATFVGTKMIGGVECEGWQSLGFSENVYYATADERRLPCQLYMGGSVTEAGVQPGLGWEVTFDIDSIRLGAPGGADLFQLPAWCNASILCDYKWGPTSAPEGAAPHRAARGATTLVV